MTTYLYIFDNGRTVKPSSDPPNKADDWQFNYGDTAAIVKIVHKDDGVHVFDRTANGNWRITEEASGGGTVDPDAHH